MSQVYKYVLTASEHRAILTAHPGERVYRHMELVADSQEDADAFLLDHLQQRFPKAALVALDGSCVGL